MNRVEQEHGPHGQVCDIIRISECVDRGVYLVAARNIRVAVYREETHGFTGVRSKNEHRYLFEEIHFDADPNCGTATPYRFVEMLPDVIHSIEVGTEYDPHPEMFAYLDEKEWGPSSPLKSENGGAP